MNSAPFIFGAGGFDTSVIALTPGRGAEFFFADFWAIIKGAHTTLQGTGVDPKSFYMQFFDSLDMF